MPMWIPNRKISLKLDTVDNASQIQQLRSGAKSVRLSTQSPNAPSIPNQISANIPRQVSNVRVSRQLVGDEYQMSVVFGRDAADPNFSGAQVWVKGYRGNRNPVLVSAGQDSPVKFFLKNTGEHIAIVVQASGDGGSAYLNGSPVKSIQI